MAVYTQKLTKAERISQSLSSLATIAKQIIAMQKLEKMDKEERNMKTAEMINKALSGEGLQAVPMEVGGQQLAPNIPSGQPDLGFGAGIGSPALPEDVLSQVGITPQGEITRTPIQPPPLPEGFTFTQVPRVPTDLESLPGKLALEAKSRKPERLIGKEELIQGIIKEGRTAGKSDKEILASIERLEEKPAGEPKEETAKDIVNFWNSLYDQALQEFKAQNPTAPFSFEAPPPAVQAELDRRVMEKISMLPLEKRKQILMQLDEPILQRLSQAKTSKDKLGEILAK